jgi:hypothetical protein
MAGALWRGHAARGEKPLGDAVFERMKGDDGEPSVRRKQMLGGAQAPRELEQLLVEIKAKRLKGPRRRVLGLVMLRPSTRATMSASRPSW